MWYRFARLTCAAVSGGSLAVAARCLSDGACEVSTFGHEADGKPIELRILRNGQLKVQVTDLGATITSVTVPDLSGVPGEITLGFDDAKPYVDGLSPYFGCVVGRFANRISRGRFSRNGRGALHTGNQ